MIGRLAPGVSPKQAQSEIEELVGEMRGPLPDNYPKGDSFGATVYPLKEEVIGGVRALLLILSGAVALVLLIACANIATMLLARASSGNAKWPSELRLALAEPGCCGRL